MRSSKRNFIFLISLMTYLFLPCDEVWAWGAGIHMAQGAFVIDHLNLIMPAIAEVIKAYPVDFLYGCISADIFIGKGSRKRIDHCHNWSIGLKMLSYAGTSYEKAFAYGYLSHLAADTVAHNFYIPNQLYITSTTCKFGHLYWEYRSDIFTEKKYWKMAKEVIVRHNSRNVAFIAQTVPNRFLPFNTKKRIYSTSIHIYDLDQWRQAVILVAQNSRWKVEKQYIDYLKKLSFYLTIDFLKNPKDAVCLEYDPIGSKNLVEAKKRRRLIKKLNGEKPTQICFEIPAEMIERLNKVRQSKIFV